MDAFDYLATFYALLLGIAVANVAMGFADMWRDRGRIEVGWCAPLLAGIVLVGSMNVWLTVWLVGERVTIDAWEMIAAVGIGLPYVFVSRAMIPPEGGPRSLEQHYLHSRALILFMLAVPAAVSPLSKILLDKVNFHGWEGAWMIARVVMPLALIPFASALVQRIGLAAMLGLLVVGLFR